MRPELYQLQYLENESEGIELRIIEAIQANWVKLADHLRLPANTVTNLQTNPIYCAPDNACRVVLETWLNRKGREPKNWYTVVKVLKELGYKELAAKIPLVLGEQP